MPDFLKLELFPDEIVNSKSICEVRLMFQRNILQFFFQVSTHFRFYRAQKIR